jgi:hypothetical protein
MILWIFWGEFEMRWMGIELENSGSLDGIQ